MKKADSTLGTSQAVPHPSTIRALCHLTSEVGRDPVYLTRYGRQRILVNLTLPCNLNKRPLSWILVVCFVLCALLCVVCFVFCALCSVLCVVCCMLCVLCFVLCVVCCVQCMLCCHAVCLYAVCLCVVSHVL